jgi:DNA-binding winged helix-turn-helix (wHTH) protein
MVGSEPGMEPILFGPFCLDLDQRRVFRGGTDLRLRPQAVHVLRVLSQHAGQPVSYEQLLKEAWDATFVSRHTVATTVSEIRKAFEECGSWIEYRPRIGYSLKVPRSDDQIRTGWHLSERRTREGLEKALACFEQASQDDPSDHRAYEGTSRMYLMLGMYGIRAPREMYREFLEAQSDAIALSGLTPELRADRAHALHIFERKYEEAETELLLAAQERPSATIYVRLILLYSARGQFEQALQALQKAHASDRFWPTLPANEVFFWLSHRDFDFAIARGKEGLDLQPYLHLGRSYYAQALEFSGRTEEALAQYRLAQTLAPDIPWLAALEAGCLARMGKHAEAAAMWERLECSRDQQYVDAYYLVPLLQALGRREDAFRELERAIEENSSALYMLDVDPKMDPLRSEPRFHELRDAAFGGGSRSN